MSQFAINEQLADEAIAIPPALMELIGKRLGKMQMLPAIAQQALEVLRDPDCSIRQFTKLVEQDIKLATEMLRMANSALYSRGHSIATLNDAATRLGLHQCRNLILTSSFASLIEGFSLEEVWIREQLWRHGLVTAVVATNLSRSLNVNFHGEEFTAGLIHDIGRIVVATILPEHFLEADPVDFQERGQPLLKQEQQLWGTTHTEVGAWFGGKNRLPNCLISAIRFHHYPIRAPRPDRQLTALIAVADDMANFVQKHATSEGYDPTENPFIDVLVDQSLPRAREILIEQASQILEKSAQDALELCNK